jgi:hypothetical protein
LRHSRGMVMDVAKLGKTAVSQKRSTNR